MPMWVEMVPSSAMLARFKFCSMGSWKRHVGRVAVKLKLPPSPSSLRPGKPHNAVGMPPDKELLPTSRWRKDCGNPVGIVPVKLLFAMPRYSIPDQP
jgi:hypothetical protein